MIKLKKPVIYNSLGEPVVLTAVERQMAEDLELEVNHKHRNSLGYEVQITTLTEVVKSVSEQKFFEVTPSDYMPVVVGQGAWKSNLLTYRSFSIGDEWETGVIDLGGANTRLAMADAGVDSLTIKIFNWAKAIGWTIFELQEASQSGNWGLIEAKESSRKENWDLGIQRIAFLGMRGQNGVGGASQGLLTQAGIAINTTLITAPISGLGTAALKTFCAGIVDVYRANCNRTAYPTHFIVPESDYNGMASQSSPDFPIKSVKQVLEETFALICMNPNFKILPLSYADAAYHTDVTSIAGKQVYTLLKYDAKSLRMDVPLPYTNTLANSMDNFSFQNAAYGQTTGVLAYRPLEMMYFQY